MEFVVAAAEAVPGCVSFGSMTADVGAIVGGMKWSLVFEPREPNRFAFNPGRLLRCRLKGLPTVSGASTGGSGEAPSGGVSPALAASEFIDCGVPAVGDSEVLR